MLSILCGLLINKLVLRGKNVGWPRDSADKGTCQKEGMPGSESQDAKNGKKEETTTNCVLTFIYVLWPVMYIYIHTHTQKQRK